MSKRIILFSLILWYTIGLNLFGQYIDSLSFSMNSRLSFYSWEKEGVMIVHIPISLQHINLRITLNIDDKEVTEWRGTPKRKLVGIPISLNFPKGVYNVTAEIKSGTGKSYLTRSPLIILNPRSNEVKTDRLTGGLIVNRRQFFPFGFYCYSPVDPALPEEEVVKGFNMISPYQKILPESLKERRAYMDRCARLGIKVHYNLLSVSGGGGVASQSDGISEEKQRDLLIQEIKEFMYHPALLAWYISDEPDGTKVPPEKLEKIYNLIKSIDPWHPVSIVFMNPFRDSEKFSKAMDIVMADPYPVPDHPVTLAGDAADQLRNGFEGEKPVWIVPQSFGGGELWSREPTVQEIRSMTYQAIVDGARGIQYFIRQGPNAFPKSTSVWDECGRIAQEMAFLTPWLLSDESAIHVSTGTQNVRLLSAVHHGQLMIMAVNRVNTPLRIGIHIDAPALPVATVLFENRQVRISAGTIDDYISAFGSQVYLVDIGRSANTMLPFKGNMLKDPGFEDLSNPSVPASCYAWNEGDKGATFFLDPREHAEGINSLRLITPEANKGPRLKFFPVRICKGRTYGISVMAKSDSLIQHTDSCKNCSACFEIGIAGAGKTRFTPGYEWSEYVTFVTIPEDIVSPKVNVILRVPCEGVVWFDMLQVFEAKDINRSIDPELIEYQNNE